MIFVSFSTKKITSPALTMPLLSNLIFSIPKSNLHFANSLATFVSVMSNVRNYCQNYWDIKYIYMKDTVQRCFAS